MTCTHCQHGPKAHAGKTKQDDQYGSALCVACWNEGDRNRAFHAFEQAKSVAA
jgi:hypothetical protein